MGTVEWSNITHYRISRPTSPGLWESYRGLFNPKFEKVPEFTKWLNGKKNLPANAGDEGDTGSIPGFRRSSGEGNRYPLPYSGLENPMDRGPLVGSQKIWRLSMHTHSVLVHKVSKPSFSIGKERWCCCFFDWGTGFGTGMEGLVYSFSWWNSPEVPSLPYWLRD